MDSETCEDVAKKGFNPEWVRKKMGHLLIHLYERERWKLETVAEVVKLIKSNPALKITVPGITDHNFPTNWGITQEENAIRFILGREFDEKETFRDVLDEMKKFVYDGEKPETFLK